MRLPPMPNKTARNAQVADHPKFWTIRLLTTQRGAVKKKANPSKKLRQMALFLVNSVVDTIWGIW
jgi:hypothetical protein